MTDHQSTCLASRCTHLGMRTGGHRCAPCVVRAVRKLAFVPGTGNAGQPHAPIAAAKVTCAQHTPRGGQAQLPAHDRGCNVIEPFTTDLHGNRTRTTE